MWRRTLEQLGLQPARSDQPANVGSCDGLVAAAGAGHQEGTPLVHDGVMFLPNPIDVAQAFDATTGDLLWDIGAQAARRLGKYLSRVPATNRNLAIYGST